MKEVCAFCQKKKVILLDCECGAKLCLQHRYREYHNCSVVKKNDEEQKKKLLTEAVHFKKLEKI